MSGNNDFPDNARARAARDTSLTKREQEHFEKLLSLYCANLRGTHGYAESTVKMYRGCMTRVVRAIGRPPWSWRPRDVDLLLSAQAERGLTAGTQAWTVTVLRGFQNYVLNDIGLCNDTQGEFGVRPQPYITTDNSIPYRRGRKGKKRSKIVTPLTPEQCDLLLKEFQFQIEVARRQHSKSYQTLRRDYAITVLALAYGVRAEEIAGIELGHFLSDREHPLFGPFAILRVIGKGSKERSIRLYAPSAADVLRWYVEHVRPAFLTRHTRNPNLLFLSERGCALSKRQYRRSLAAMAAKAGLRVHVHPHLLRHTYATAVAEPIGHIALQHQLGHEYLSTTLGTYFHQDPEEVGNEVRRGVDNMTAAFDRVTQDASDANRR